MRHLAVLVSLLAVAAPTAAEVYSYANEDGDYVISKSKPKNPNISYAILSDDGEFIRMVEGRGKQIPITHWRPFFLPKEPHPYDGQPPEQVEQEPVVTIDEVDKAQSE